MPDDVKRFTLASPVDIPDWLREDMGHRIGGAAVGGRMLELSFQLRNLCDVTLQSGDTIEKTGPDSYRIDRFSGESEEIRINPAAEFRGRWHA